MIPSPSGYEPDAACAAAATELLTQFLAIQLTVPLQGFSSIHALFVVKFY
jgi:hypothetical protein